MAYTITKTDGTTLGTITDGTINTSFTSLTLIGRNYANYGELIANDLVALVENFAYSTSPSNPLSGQLWWNTSDKRLRVYTGTEFKVVSSCTAQTTAPSTTIAGDLWWDTAYNQLYIYNGTSPYSASGWILVGPQRNNSGAVWEQISDGTLLHDVVSVKLNGVRQAIYSTDSAFTPANAIVGFSSIKPGTNANASVGSGSFWGLANNSSYLGGQPAASYLRSDTNDTTSGTLSILNDTGLTVGVDSDLTLVVNGTDIEVKNKNSNGDINFYSNVSGTNTLTLGVDGSTGKLIAKSLTLSDTTTSTSASTGALIVSGGVGINENLNVAGTGTITGNLYAPTQSVGTADTTVATTEFVINNSGFYKYKIYDGSNSHIWINDSGTATANLVLDGTAVMSATAGGVHLESGATTDTQPDTYNGTGNAAIATTQFVKTATTWWDGSAKFVSTAEPDPGVNDIGSNDGDFWFQRES